MTSVLSNASARPVRRYFGTDGVRGIANTELSPQLALALGAAAARVLRATSTSLEVVVGRDPRVSGDLLQAALSAGLASQGMQVALLGVVPTPGVAFVTRARGAAAGVVLSASHNPMQDNGIKFFGPDGKKLSDELEARIEAAMEGWEDCPRPSHAGVGRIYEASFAVAEYAAHLKAIAGFEDLHGWKVVVDGANGAASYLAPSLLTDLGAEVLSLSCAPDGVNINADCGSLHPETLARTVVSQGAVAGMAFDGDADRVILADEKGRIFDGDRILCAAGIWLKQQGQLPGDVVVGTIMSNLGLEAALSRHGIRLLRAAVGDRYVSEMMTAHGATLGGEKSGHILLQTHTTTGDGLLTALQVLRICRESGRTLAEWAEEMEEYPQKLVSIPVRERDGWESNPALAAAIRDAEAQLKDRGRINVRPSGTEKKIRVMVEGPDPAEVEAICEQVSAVLRRELGA